MVAEINYSALGTWLEPYIGWRFTISKRCKASVKVKWWGRDRTILNKFIKVKRYGKPSKAAQ